MKADIVKRSMMVQVRLKYNGPNDTYDKVSLKHGDKYLVLIGPPSEGDVAFVYVIKGNKITNISYSNIDIFASDWGREAVSILKEVKNYNNCECVN